MYITKAYIFSVRALYVGDLDIMLLYINYFSDNNNSTMDTPALPPILLQRIKLLVSKHPVLSEQSFTAHFFEMFHEDLDPLAAGYPSISSLLDTLASLKVVHLTYGNFGIIIKPSLGTLKETRMMPREGSDLTELDNITTIQHEECVFPPKDCVLSHNLPVEELPHWMKEGEIFRSFAQILMTEMFRKYR